MVDWRARVLEYLDGNAGDVVTELAGLVRLPSVSGSDEENEVQALLAARLASIGLEVDHWPIPLAEVAAADGFPGVEVERREAWGLVGRLPGTGGGASLMLNAHVDVVPAGEVSAWAGGDPFSGAIAGGAGLGGAVAEGVVAGGAVADGVVAGGAVAARAGVGDAVYGRGACDMKAGLVAALWALRAIAAVRAPLAGDLLLACVQGEEDGGLGTFATLARGWRADACVIPEPTSLDLVPAAGGALTFRLHVPGRAAHASRRTTGVSAVEVFLPVFRALRELEARRNRGTDPLMARWDVAYPIEIGVVHAGSWPSSVPDTLVADGRLGVALDEPVAAARDAFCQAVADACDADPWLREHPVRVQWWGGQFAPGRTDPGHPIAAAVRRAHAAVSDRTQRTWGAPYGSDLRLMTAAGVPTVHYGPGDPGLAHAPDEHVPVAEVLTAARALAVLALDHCAPR